MNNFSSALWAETLKMIRSKVPLTTALGFCIAPLAGGLFMIILKDPEMAKLPNLNVLRFFLAMVVMLGSFAPGTFNVFSGAQRPPTLGTRTDAGADAAFTALVHADPQTIDLPELLVDMGSKVASGYLFGGISNGRGKAVQIADRVLSGGLSGVVFSSDVRLVSRVSQGVHRLPAASRHQVTRATNNLIVELDGPQAGEVLAIEKDARLVAFLNERFAGQSELRLLQADALEYLRSSDHDWTGWKLVSNLPYSVASPILVELAQNPRGPERMVATLQLEVARRLMASSGNQDYGLLTLLVQLDYEPRDWFKVPAGCFFPEPDVDSACVCLVRRRSPLLWRL